MMRGRVKKSRTYETIQEQTWQLAWPSVNCSSTPALLGSIRLGYENEDEKIIKSERHFSFSLRALFLTICCTKGKVKSRQVSLCRADRAVAQSWSRTPASEMNDERL